MAGVIPSGWPHWKLKGHDVTTDTCPDCRRSGREVTSMGHNESCPRYVNKPIPADLHMTPKPPPPDDEIPPNWRTGKTRDEAYGFSPVKGKKRVPHASKTDVCAHNNPLDDVCIFCNPELQPDLIPPSLGRLGGVPRAPTDHVAALPTGYNERKALPLYDFMFGYFPLAWLEVVKVAVAGNQQHNPGEKLHWAREKSTDQLNTAFRHLFDHGMGTHLDTDGCYHLAKVIWRLSAELQLLVEKNKS